MKKKIYKKLLEEGFVDICLIMLPADLLYLRFAGGWQESILIIEVSELIFLSALILYGIRRLIRLVRIRKIELLQFGDPNWKVIDVQQTRQD